MMRPRLLAWTRLRSWVGLQMKKAESTHETLNSVVNGVACIYDANYYFVYSLAWAKQLCRGKNPQ